MAGVGAKAGQRLGKYDLLGEVGRDGDAVLHRAVDPATGRAVELRTFPLTRFAGRDAALERFRRDARAATRLTHPNIVAIQFSGEHGGTAFVATAPAEGRRLDHRLPLPWEEGLAVLTAVLDALARAHRGGVVHGGLSAAMVRLTPDGSVMVGGFGMAALSAPDATERDDLRAAGTLAAALLAGHEDRPGVAALLARARSDGFPDAASMRDAVAALALPIAEPQPNRPRIWVPVAGALLLGLIVASGVAWQRREPVVVAPPPAPVEATPPAAVPEPLPEPEVEGKIEAPAEEPFPELPLPEPPPSLEELLPEPGPAETPAGPPIAAIRAALQELPCALLTVEALNGRILVSGTAAGEPVLAAVRATLDRGASGWDHGLDVAVAPPGLCAPLTLLAAPLAANAALAAPLRVAPTGGTSLHGGDPLILDINGPADAAELRVDYFTADGSVIHLLPNPLEPNARLDGGATRVLGNRAAGGRFWSVGPPFGHELILAIATPTPLFATARPEAEPAAAYLAELKRALASSGGSSPLATALFIATAP